MNVLTNSIKLETEEHEKIPEILSVWITEQDCTLQSLTLSDQGPLVITLQQDVSYEFRPGMTVVDVAPDFPACSYSAVISVDQDMLDTYGITAAITQSETSTRENDYNINFDFTNEAGFTNGVRFRVDLQFAYDTDIAFRSSPKSNPPINWGNFEVCSVTGEC